jgi:sugar lactone lactonase YvrE
MNNNTNFSQRSSRRRTVTRALRGRMLIVLGAGLALLSCLPTASQAASAVSSYAVGGQFGQTPERGDGRSAGSGVAVGQSNGNIFVAEHNFGTVGVFTPDVGSGETLVANPDPTAVGISALNLAVDPDDAALYVNDTVFSNGIVKLLSDGAPAPAYTMDSGFAVPAGAITGPRGMAVDPITHDLLVVDGDSNRVFRLSSSTGAVISSFDGADTAAGAFQGAAAVAVGPTGTIYVVDVAGARVERFSAAGTSIGALSLVEGAQPSSVTVNPQNGKVAVLLAAGDQTYLQGFTAVGAQAFTARVTAGVTAPGFGIAWDGGTNRIYASVGGGFVRTLVPATQPGVDAPVATPGRNTVHLTADVDPGGETTTGRFEYCPASADCASYAISDPSNPSNPWQRGPAHDGLTTAGQITDDLPLSSNASWRVRVSAVNTASGADSTSSTVSFDSPLLAPGVTTEGAGSVTDSQAELAGTIDTMGAQATYHFEYGLTTNYGSRVPAASEAPAGNNRRTRSVVKSIAGLQSGTTYHYRLVANNSAGENAGTDRTFTTAGPDDVAPGRSYEQVTPADKEGAQVVSGFHVQTAADGWAIAVTTQSATPDADAARILQNYMSRRGASDWLDWQEIDAPQNAAPGLLEGSTAAVSPDFDHALVVSNRALAPGGIVGGGNIYIKDLRTGEYTFVAGAPGNDAYQHVANIQANETIYMAGAPDFSWILFWGQPSFLPGATGGPAIYRWSRTGGLTLESRLPDGTVPSGVLLPNQRTFPSASSQGDIVAFGADNSVYRRIGDQTTAIAVSHIAGDPPDPQPATFDAMTPDGRYVFFHSPVALTDAAAAAPPGSGDLVYRYDATTGNLLFIVRMALNNSLAFYGAGDDGKTVYFDDAAGTEVWRDGQVHNVSGDHIVSTQDQSRPPTFQWYVTANGRYFAWLGEDGQAHRYDAEANQSVCVSCPTDGSSGKAASLIAGGRGIGNRAQHVMTENGLLFFTTSTRLVSADHNGTKDVYAYGDRPALISPGDGAYDAFFVDASDDGKDIFFQTDEALVSRDTDESSDVYDARVGGGFPAQSPLPPPAPCVRAACGEVATGPVISPSASSSTTGASAGPKRTNQEKVTLSLSRVSFGSKSVKITFKASQRGRLRVTGSRVTTTVRNVAGTGTYSITVPLSKKTSVLMRAHKKVKVSLKVSLSGGWGSASAKYSRTLGN